jgi:hypothetical protein
VHEKFFIGLTDSLAGWFVCWLFDLFIYFSNMKCQRKTFVCPQGDADCLYAPLSYSTNFITFPSKIRIPADLFTMRGPLSPYRRLVFDLKLIKAADPRTGQQRVSRSKFNINQVGFLLQVVCVHSPLIIGTATI